MLPVTDYLLSSFSCDSPSDHQDLHSFPTRRSSDLKCAIIVRRWFGRSATVRNMLGMLPRSFRYVSKIGATSGGANLRDVPRSEEHTSELQSPDHLVCRLLLEKKNT